MKDNEKIDEKPEELKKTEPEGKVFFIVGIRRSGTSIIRKLISMSDEIEGVLFEPHDLWHATMMLHFKRLRKPEHKQKIRDFQMKGNGKWIGAKFALNPGIDALDWVWLSRVYPDAKFIFVIRNEDDCFHSYLDKDKNSVRGAVPQHIYAPVYHWLIGSLADFARHKSDRACIVHYDRMLDDADKEFAKVWKLLDVKPVTGMQLKIQTPVHTEGNK